MATLSDNVVTAASNRIAPSGVKARSSDEYPRARESKYAATSVTNLVASGAVIALELRTASPRRVLGYARAAVAAPRGRATVLP
jgi:hypothetical protein